MVKKTKLILKGLEENFVWDYKTIGTFFLGVGFIMFILNITTIFNLMHYNPPLTIPMNGYYTSTLSSIFLMGYSLYNIYKSK